MRANSLRTTFIKTLALPRRMIETYTGSLNKNTIEYWQHYIFYVIAFVGIIAGTLCIVPSVILIIFKGRILSAAALLFFYSINTITVLAKSLSLKQKTLIIGMGFYLIGVISLIVGGPVGESGIWFATTCLLCSLFVGFGFALASAIINLLTGIAFGLLYASGLIGWYFLKDYSLVSWLIQSSNIFLICMMFAIANSILVSGLDATFVRLNATEEKNRASLNEKETLIGELYHRTKNNMQVVSSLLMLYSSGIGDEKARTVFRDIESKIQSMSLVHQKLYGSQNLSSIDMAEYVRDLAVLLLKSHKVSGGKVALETDLENIPFTIDAAIPCGLVINELVTNALKYGFPGERRGRISISLHEAANAKAVELRVSDDGVGVRSGFDIETDGKMGMKTVMMIVRHQLRGDLEFSGGNGVSFIIRFTREPFGKKKQAYERG